MALHIFILHSPTFWEVRPATKRGMKLLLDYIRMRKTESRGTPESESTK